MIFFSCVYGGGFHVCSDGVLHRHILVNQDATVEETSSWSKFKFAYLQLIHEFIDVTVF